ncbi:pyruvate, water dikinase regulatory protein [Gorillibacterium sp. sgz5001074]|uniref:pyruvate, water dikinase regulatory protein n=1 Tax=Gorillibacterium sp. sgz5001074 TaxID=3446695 RepID=UPI003F66B5FE
MGNKQQWLYICSDSVGETAEAVAQATLRQFQVGETRIKRWSNIRHEDEIRRLMEEAARVGGFVAFTLVQPELREMIKAESIRLEVRVVDILGPMMQAFVETFGDAPKWKPGLLHELDEEYFRRVDAMEFAVKYDDGKDAKGLLMAEVILVGVSRTSKTPLSIYLAHKGIKAANLPIMPEVKPPEELFKINPSRIFGLTMNAEHILNIRTERLKAVGLPGGSRYASPERVREELEYGSRLMARLGCSVIDVTNKAIEETAGVILETLGKLSSH